MTLIPLHRTMRHRIIARHLPATTGGLGPAPVVAFVHGMADRSAVWATTLAALPHCDRWAFELPWSGMSGADWPSERSTAAWIAEAARQCPVAPDLWVGHSFGALALLEWQLSHPTAGNLLLISPLFAARDQSFDATAIAAYSRDVPNMLAAMIADRLPRPVSMALLGAMAAHLADRVLPDGVPELFRALAAVAAAPLDQLVGRVMLVRGDSDLPVSAGSTDRLAARLDMDVEILSHCGHTPMVNDSAAVAALVERVLTPAYALAS